jgi:serine/threonine protein kinase/tetratricopeptide (TPR) repeat protein
VHFGPYEIVEKIGSGGMGEVYRALDTRLDREVALKLVSENYLIGDTPRPSGGSPGCTPILASNARFQREARAASALNHPNICTIHDIGEQDGRPYLVMELLQGETLKQYLAGHRKLPAAELLNFARQAAGALAAAHGRGIIHRDIKPANIFVVQPKGGQPHIKILDFGLAKRQGAGINPTDSLGAPTGTAPGSLNGDRTAGGDHTEGGELTSAGSTLGTIAYMSPEQAKGQPLDARTDLFSLGSVLYEAATGASPFAGASPAETFAALLMKDPLPASSVNPELPKEFDSILARLLAKDKEARYSSAAELLADLDKLGDARPVAVPPRVDAGSVRGAAGVDAAKDLGHPIPETARRAWILIVGVAAVIIAASLFFLLRNHGGVSPTGGAAKAPVTMGEKDSIILADFVNNTGNPVFDTTLKQALAIQLEQSPTLNIVSQQHLQQSMKYLGKSSEDPLTPAIAREIGEREGVKAILTGTIASLGKEYVITLTAQATATGDDIASEQAQAPDAEHVLDALGKAATAMRAKLGESLSSIQKLDTPLGQATTPSLEAFRAYAVGDVEHNNGLDLPQAAGHYQQAVELDPNFAMAWARLGVVYSNAGQTGKALEYFTKAYNLSKNVSERERLYITGHYYQNVTGNVDKVIETLELSMREYPNDFNSMVNIAVAYTIIGDYDKALEYSRKAVATRPDDVIAQENLIQDLVVLDRFQEAQEQIAKVNNMGLGDATGMLSWGYYLDALENDTTGMNRLMSQATGRPDAYQLLSAKAFVEEYLGQYQRAQATWQAVIEQSASQKANDAEASALLSLVSGRGFAGMCQDSESRVKRALALDRTKPTLRQAAFTAAICGDRKTAEPILKDLDKKYPEDTTVQGITIPQTRALLDLAEHKPADARAELEKSKAYDLASPGAYLRGLAYLDLHDAPNAVVAFQRATQYRGAIVPQGFQVYPQSVLGLARAYAMQGDKTHAREAYQKFFDMWKSADPDLPQLVVAKKEFAAL